MTSFSGVGLEGPLQLPSGFSPRFLSLRWDLGFCDSIITLAITLDSEFRAHVISLHYLQSNRAFWIVGRKF